MYFFFLKRDNRKARNRKLSARVSSYTPLDYFTRVKCNRTFLIMCEFLCAYNRIKETCKEIAGANPSYRDTEISVLADIPLGPAIYTTGAIFSR